MKELQIIGYDGEWYCPIGLLCQYVSVYWKESLDRYPEIQLIRDLMLVGY